MAFGVVHEHFEVISEMVLTTYQAHQNALLRDHPLARLGHRGFFLHHFLDIGVCLVHPFEGPNADGPPVVFSIRNETDSVYRELLNTYNFNVASEGRRGTLVRFPVGMFENVGTRSSYGLVTDADGLDSVVEDDVPETTSLLHVDEWPVIPSVTATIETRTRMVANLRTCFEKVSSSPR